jgi:hypothetical protein
MNIPTIDSTPGSSAGRPDTVVPNTTSSSPPQRDSNSAQAPWMIVLMVRPRRCAARRSWSERCASTVTRTDALDSARWASTGWRS